MIELARHIEILLLDNDCVIVPGLGGFVSHPVAAHRIDDEGLFMPPGRTLGFNPMMKLNDGLLVQSYMTAYDVTYPEAVKLVEARVDSLRLLLQEKGEVELHGIGTLRMNIREQYTFTPLEAGILSPTLYGLSSFDFPTLEERSAHEVAQTNRTDTVTAPADKPEKSPAKPIVIHLNRSWINNAVAVAVAIILFFVLSIPVENQYVTDNGNTYADLQQTFEQIRHQSMVSSLWNESQPMLTPKARPVNPKTDQSKTESPVTKQEKPAQTQPAPAPKEKQQLRVSTEEVQQERFFTIVLASQVTVKNAERFAEKLKARGLDEAEVLTLKNITRVIYSRLTTEQEAYRKLRELKDEPEFGQAWIMQVK